MERITGARDELQRAIAILLHLAGESEDHTRAAELGKRASLLRSARARVKVRNQRRDILGKKLWNEASWDVLLALYTSWIDGIRLCVTDVAVMTGIPNATAIRWLGAFVDEGLLVRKEDAVDHRRTWVQLSRKGIALVEHCLDLEIDIPAQGGANQNALTASGAHAEAANQNARCEAIPAE